VQIQKTLENKQLPTKEKPWTGLCCARCYRAKSDKKRCRCRCHGAHHAEQRLRTFKMGMESKTTKTSQDVGKEART